MSTPLICDDRRLAQIAAESQLVLGDHDVAGLVLAVAGDKRVAYLRLSQATLFDIAPAQSGLRTEMRLHNPAKQLSKAVFAKRFQATMEEVSGIYHLTGWYHAQIAELLGTLAGAPTPLPPRSSVPERAQPSGQPSQAASPTAACSSSVPLPRSRASWGTTAWQA